MTLFDLLGLSPESDLEDVLEFLRKCHPELFVNEPEVDFDTTGDLEEREVFGTTSLITGNIKLNPNYAAPIDLAGNAGHEVQHSAAGRAGNAWMIIEDVLNPTEETGKGPTHSEIYRKDFEIRAEFDEYQRRKEEGECNPDCPKAGPNGQWQ